MEKTSNFMSFIKSLKCRLTVFAVIIAVIPGLVVGIGILFSYEQRAVSLRESEVLSQARILSNQVATSNYIDGTNSSETLLAQMSMLTNIYDGRILIVDDNFEILYDTYNLDNNRTIISEEVIRSFKGEEMTSYDSENRYLEMSIPITNPNDETGTILGVLVVSISTDNIALNLSYLTQIATVIVFLVILVVGFIAVMSSIRIVAPLTKLSDGIASVQGGISDRDLMVNDYTETIIICEKFNEMMRKIRVMDESRQEFVSNVSHELKTPLTSMKVLADSLNSMPDAPVELQIVALMREMQNAECKMNVFPAEMIIIVGEADTIILHFAFYILHWAAQAARQIPICLRLISGIIHVFPPYATLFPEKSTAAFSSSGVM